MAPSHEEAVTGGGGEAGVTEQQLKAQMCSGPGAKSNRLMSSSQVTAAKINSYSGRSQRMEMSLTNSSGRRRTRGRRETTKIVNFVTQYIAHCLFIQIKGKSRVTFKHMRINDLHALS